MKILLRLAFLSVVLGVVGCDGGSSTEPPAPNPNPIVTEPVPTPTPVPIPGPDEPEPVVAFERAMSNPGITPPPVVLKWEASHAESCNAMNGEETSWAGAKDLSGTEVVSGVQTDKYYMFQLECTGKGGSVTRSVEVMIASPPPPPPPPPPPIKALFTCVAPDVLLSMNPPTDPEGFVSVTTQCIFQTQNPVTPTQLSVRVDGFDGKVSSVRMIEYVATMKGTSCNYVTTPVARVPVIGGVATFPLTDFRLGPKCNKDTFPFGKLFSFAVEFEKPIAHLGVSELSRNLRLNVAAGDIKTVESVVFLNSFPVQVGSGLMTKGKLFFTENNEVFRLNLETGEKAALTYSYGSSYSLHDDMYLSRDGKRIMFQRWYPYVIDSDGAGCTDVDIPVVTSPGCNKGFTTVPLGLYGSNTSTWAMITDGFSPDGTMLAYARGIQTTPGGSFLTNVYLAKMNPFGIEQITTGSYGVGSAVIGSTGVYFYSCRPGCGIFWTAVDFSTGKPFGDIKLIYAHADGGLILTSMSADEKQFLLEEGFPSDVSTKVFLVGTDGVFRTIGSGAYLIGAYAKFVSDGRILWIGQEGAVLANADGSNQMHLRVWSRSGYAFIP